MCSRITLFVTSVILLAAVASEQRHIKRVNGTAGQSITLHTGVSGLHGDFQVVWTNGPQKDVLLHFDDGKLEQNKSSRYLLDTRTGSLTIENLSINDTGFYQGQIINGNGSKHSFNLTVVVPAPAGTVEPTSPREDQRSHVALALPFVLLIVLLVIAVAVRQKKIKGRRRLNPGGRLGAGDTLDMSPETNKH